jgi:hypothetical protein
MKMSAVVIILVVAMFSGSAFACNGNGSKVSLLSDSRTSTSISGSVKGIR